MRVPLSWLRDFTPVEGTPEEIARVLSFLGLVVEGTEQVGAPLDGIVVARVLATHPHPAADRIQLVDVDVGDGQALQICCGAFNMSRGRSRPAGDRRDHNAERARDRTAQTARRVVQRDVVLGAGAGRRT